MRTISQKLLHHGQVTRCADDQDVPDAGQHQHRHGIIDHRLVVDRQQLLRDGQGGRVQAGAGAAGQEHAVIDPDILASFEADRLAEERAIEVAARDLGVDPAEFDR